MRRSLTLSAVPLTKLLQVSVCFVGGLGILQMGKLPQEEPRSLCPRPLDILAYVHLSCLVHLGFQD